MAVQCLLEAAWHIADLLAMQPGIERVYMDNEVHWCLQAILKTKKCHAQTPNGLRFWRCLTTPLHANGNTF